MSLNLDRIAACVSQQIAGNTQAKELENMATKALGVLQEQGVYAMILFLYSKRENVAYELIKWLDGIRAYVESLDETDSSNDNTNSCPVEPTENVSHEREEILQTFANLSSDLNTLLLVRDLFEQLLIYARYHAKAKAQEDGGGS